MRDSLHVGTPVIRVMQYDSSPSSNSYVSLFYNMICFSLPTFVIDQYEVMGRIPQMGNPVEFTNLNKLSDTSQRQSSLFVLKMKLFCRHESEQHHMSL
jgi:hypothetical protein